MNNSGLQNILVVTPKPALAMLIDDVLSSDRRFSVACADTFYAALDRVIADEFALVIVENHLGDMTGLDLLTALARLLPDLPVIIVDNQLSARASLAAFRLGAADYIAQPLQPDMLLMQVLRILQQQNMAHTHPVTVPDSHHEAATEDGLSIVEPERAFHLNAQQSMSVTQQLMQFHTQVRATFAGLVDNQGEIIASTGTLKNEDVELVRRSLARNKANSLAHVLSEQRFNANYLEGETYNVYMVEFGAAVKLSLVAICEATVKSGVVLFFAKQLVEEISQGGMLECV